MDSKHEIFVRTGFQEVKDKHGRKQWTVDTQYHVSPTYNDEIDGYIAETIFPYINSKIHKCSARQYSDPSVLTRYLPSFIQDIPGNIVHGLEHELDTLFISGQY